MFRQESILIGLVAAVIFGTVAGASWLAGRAMQAEARLIARDTLPALVNSADAMSKMQENWLNLNRLEDVRSAADRRAMVEGIRTNSNTETWQRYRMVIGNSDRQVEFLAMSVARTNYLQLRDVFLAMFATRPLPEALAFRDAQLAPAYAQYAAASKRLFTAEAREGGERALRVTRSSRYISVALGLFGVVVFVFGVLLGLRGAFVGMELASFFQKR